MTTELDNSTLTDLWLTWKQRRQDDDDAAADGGGGETIPSHGPHRSACKTPMATQHHGASKTTVNCDRVHCDWMQRLHEAMCCSASAAEADRTANLTYTECI